MNQQNEVKLDSSVRVRLLCSKTPAKEILIGKDENGNHEYQIELASEDFPDLSKLVDEDGKPYYVHDPDCMVDVSPPYQYFRVALSKAKMLVTQLTEQGFYEVTTLNDQ